jgi:hypothetical protein
MSHEVVRLMLRLFIVLDPTFICLIQANPRYKMMMPEEDLKNL